MIAGCAISCSSHLLVDDTCRPAARSERSSRGGESSDSCGSSSASRTSSARRAMFRGTPPAPRGPSTSSRIPAWWSASHGTPAARASAATRAPADSAASSSRSRPGSPAAASAASCRASSRSTSSRSSRLGRSSSNRAGACSSSAANQSTSLARSAPGTAFVRIAWHSRRSWQRSTRTPAASSGGYHSPALAHTHRTGRSASRAATQAGNSAAASVRRTAPGAAATIRPPLARPRAMRDASPQGSLIPSI